MAINIQYGPISAALGLAAQAGAGQGIRQQNSDQFDYDRLLQQAKNEQDQQHATAISQALQSQQITSENALRQQSLAQQAAIQQAQLGYHYDALGQRTDNSDANRQVRQQVADQQGQKISAVQDVKTSEQTAAESYLNSLPDGPAKDQATQVYRATGKLPPSVIPQAAPRVTHLADDVQVQLLKTELDHAKQDMSDAMKAKQAYVRENAGLLDDNDDTLKDLTSKEAMARKAYSDKFNDLRTRMMSVSQGSGSPAPIAGTPSPTQAATSAPTINTPQDYAQLPSGSLYVDAADGQTYRKR